MPEQMHTLHQARKVTDQASVPLHKHGAFNDLTAHLQFIQLGIAALKGVGALLRPENHDQQLNGAFSSEASAVFEFFGEALKGPANEAYDAKERLEQAARGEQS